MNAVSKSAAVTFNPHNQNRESVHRVVDQILRKAGCEACGRLAILETHFLGDPAPDMVKEGVISFESQGI